MRLRGPGLIEDLKGLVASPCYCTACCEIRRAFDLPDPGIDARGANRRARREREKARKKAASGAM